MSSAFELDSVITLLFKKKQKNKKLLYGHLEPIVADSLKDNVENSSSLSYARIEVAEELIF